MHRIILHGTSSRRDHGHADVLRLALSRLDIDVALGEILHFLTHDERLPGRTPPPAASPARQMGVR